MKSFPTLSCLVNINNETKPSKNIIVPSITVISKLPETRRIAVIVGTKGVLHGMMTYLLQNKEGQIQETHSISAGLDYPGVGPEHAYLKDSKRVKYRSATDDEVVDAFLLLTRTEGIIPALESAHAVAEAAKIARKRPKSDTIVITLSGRGDKDVEVVEEYLRKNVKNR